MIKKLIPLIFILCAIALFWILGLEEYLNKNYILDNKQLIQNYINDDFALSIILFGAIYAGVVALSLPFASFMTLMAGFFFGLYWGVFIVIFSATLGATFIFLISKGSFGRPLRKKAGKIYKRIESDMNKNAVSYLLFLRLVPLFPFFLVNIIPALFNIKTRTYIWTTAIGILPGSTIYVNIGQSLDRIENPSDFISPDIILAIALLGLFVMIPTVYKKIKIHKKVES